MSIWALKIGPGQGAESFSHLGQGQKWVSIWECALQKARCGKGPVPICHYLFPVCFPKYEPEVFAWWCFFFFLTCVGVLAGGPWSDCRGYCSSSPISLCPLQPFVRWHCQSAPWSLFTWDAFLIELTNVLLPLIKVLFILIVACSFDVIHWSIFEIIKRCSKISLLFGALTETLLFSTVN